MSVLHHTSNVFVRHEKVTYSFMYKNTITSYRYSIYVSKPTFHVIKPTLIDEGSKDLIFTSNTTIHCSNTILFNYKGCLTKEIKSSDYVRVSICTT